MILIKAYFNLLITGIQACGLSSIGRLLQALSFKKRGPHHLKKGHSFKKGACGILCDILILALLIAS